MYALVAGAPVSARTAPSPAIVRLMRVSGTSSARRRPVASSIVERRALRELVRRQAVAGAGQGFDSAVPRPPGAGLAVLLRACGRPTDDLRAQGAGGRDDLVLVDLRLAVELDLPQFLGEPPRKVASTAGVNAAPALIRRGAGAHPYSRLGPCERAERTDATRSQKLVSDHLPPSLFARNADRRASDGSGERVSPSAPSDAIVASICSR